MRYSEPLSSSTWPPNAPVISYARLLSGSALDACWGLGFMFGLHGAAQSQLPYTLLHPGRSLVTEVSAHRGRYGGLAARDNGARGFRFLGVWHARVVNALQHAHKSFLNPGYVAHCEVALVELAVIDALGDDLVDDGAYSIIGERC